MSKKLWLLLNIIVLLVSCKPKENIIVQKSLARLSDGETERLILNRNKDIKTVRLARINFYVNINGEELKSGGTIGIIRDSVIIISLIPALGYEILRIFCYKDKILVLDRIEKTFFYTNIERNINKYKIRADYSDIEALLTGKAFIYGNQYEEIKLKKSIKNETDKLKLIYNLLDNEFIKTSQEIIVKKDSLLTESNNISDRKENILIDIKYDQFISIDGFSLPREVILGINSPDNKLSLKIDIGNIVINEKINAENTIPAKYEEAIIDY
jgi:hypothetical protein